MTRIPPLRRQTLIFLRKVREQVPELSYAAYVTAEAPGAIPCVYIYAFTTEGEIEGGYELAIAPITGLFLASDKAVGDFFAFCRASVPLVFSSNAAREMWHASVKPDLGTQQLGAIRHKPF